MVLTYIVNQDDDKKELKNLLKRKLYISNELIIKLKKSKSIFVNDQNVHVNKILNLNDIIKIDFDNMVASTENKSFIDKFKVWDIPINILYEDQYLIILDKPPNVIVHPVSAEYEHTLSNALINYLIKKDKKYVHENIHIVTRLDKDTSGICIFAKNAYIKQLFAAKKNTVKLSKEYIAVVNGIIQNQSGIIQKNIKRKDDSIITRCVDDSGDFAKTQYFVLSRNYEKNYTVVKVKIYTGRTHQIRVHMAYINHVILGDDLYAKEYGIQDIRKYINRQALHCAHVTFYHPITNKYINISSPMPKDIQSLIELKK